MKQQKKTPKKDDTKKAAASKAPVSKRGKELSEDQLEHVSGGAYDAFLKIDDANATSLKVDLKID